MKSSFIFVFCIMVNSVVSAEVHTGTDDLAQLPYWELRSKAMTFRLVQRLPDQTRAYFSGRGFSKEDAEYVAGYCVFQTVFTNTSSVTSQHVIQYDASKWRTILHEGKENKERSLALREYWEPVWRQRQAKKPQRIAFNWSLLPTRQQYQSADYNWGMTIYKLPHGSMFDLKLFWALDGVMQNAIIKNLQCAKDIYVPPVAQ